MMDSNQPNNTPAGMTCLNSRYPFAETVTRLLAALQRQQIKVFATIDQQAEAAAAGLAMPPATLIVFGNPKAGTQLMLARPTAGIDLPLKVLVSEALPGRVSVMFNTAAYLIQRHALPPQLAASIAPVERLIATTVTIPFQENH